MPVRETIGDAQGARVELNFGAGRLNVQKAEGKQYLVDGTAANVRKTYTVTDGVGRLELNQDTGRFLFLPPFGDDRRVTWDIGLTGAIPLDLSVETGAGQANLDLTGLVLRMLDLNAGVVQTRVTFPAEGRIEAAISGGVGELLISLPKGLPTRMTVSTGLGNFSAPSTFTRRGDVYETPDFSTEADYLDLTLSLGVGSVVVK